MSEKNTFRLSDEQLGNVVGGRTYFCNSKCEIFCLTDDPRKTTFLHVVGTTNYIPFLNAGDASNECIAKGYATKEEIDDYLKAHQDQT